jgi:hypothetical protein
MCTRANSASVHDSFQAVVGSLFALAGAALALAVALASVPWRVAASRPTKHGKPASTRHVEVQVHLNDGQRVRVIERACRAALARAARTWAPFPLPLDRVEVISSAPPAGKSDIFEQWITVAGQAEHGAAALVVVSVGTTLNERDLSPDEIAGALAGQVERLVIDRYRREHPACTAAPMENGPVLQLTTPVPVVVADADRVAGARPADNVTDIRALLEGIKKSQPLVPAGPSKNGFHTEPDSAS